MSVPFGVELPENLGSESTEAAPETSSSAPESTAPEKSLSEAPSTQTPKKDFLDLDKLERFRFSGREWSPDELKKSILRNSDYTKKMQELSRQREDFERRNTEVSTNQRFAENFHFDLQKVIAQPALLSELAKVYPPQYVQAAKNVLAKLGVNEQADPQKAQSVDPRVQAELAEMRNWMQGQQAREREQEIARIGADLDTKFQKLGTKYPEADPEVVNTRAQAVVASQKAPITDAQLEKLFKQHHDQVEQRLVERQRARVEAQRKANQKGKDMGPGGGVPGQAPKKLTIKEATQQALADAEAGRISW